MSDLTQNPAQVYDMPERRASRLPLYRRFGTKLTLTFMVLVIAAVLLSSYAGIVVMRRGYERIVHDEFETTLNVAQNFVGTMADVLADRSQLIVSHQLDLAHLMATENPERVQQFLKDHVASPTIDEIVVLDRSGLVVARMSGTGSRGQRFDYLDIVKRTLAGEAGGLSIIDERDGLMLFSSVAIVDGGEMRGVALVGLALDNWFAERIKANTGVEVTIVRDRAVMGSTLKAQGRKPIAELPLPYLEYQMLLAGNGGITEARILGDRYFVAARSLQLLDSQTTGSIFLAVPRRQLDSIEANIYRTFVFLVIAVVGLAGLAAWWTTRRLTGPVKALTNVANRLARGEDGLPVSMTDTSEFGQLAQAWNAMQESIRDKNAALRRHSETLEHKVHERTAQLSAANAQLRENESELAAVIDNVMDGVIAINTAGIVRSFNKAAETIFGYAADEVVGQNIKMLMPPSISENHDGFLARYLTTGEAKVIGYGREVQGLRKDGQVFPLLVGVTEIVDSAGRHSFIGTLQDLTERQRAEESIRRAQKMEAVGQMVGGIAHDFNNLLGIVIGNLEILEFECQAESDLKKHKRVENALKGAWRGADLTKRLLAFSSKKTRAGKVLVVNALLDDMRDLLAKSVTRSVDIELDLAGELWPVEIDPGEFETSIINLGINAHDAMPDGGKLSISTANISLSARQSEDRNILPGDYVRITVRDTGHGIPPDIRDRVFEPFFSTKPMDKGTGLGLSMVYGFVARSRGHIRVDSVPGEGTVFEILLPRSQAVAAEVDPTGVAPVAELPRGSETILIVDDEENLIDIAEGHLLQLGYRILRAANGNEALAALENGTEIDLLFSDVIMPGGIDGFELARRIRQDRPDQKILLTSGYMSHREGIEEPSGDLQTQLAANVLPKPYTKSELAEAIRDALDGEDRKDEGLGEISPSP